MSGLAKNDLVFCCKTLTAILALSASACCLPSKVVDYGEVAEISLVVSGPTIADGSDGSALPLGGALVGIYPVFDTTQATTDDYGNANIRVQHLSIPREMFVAVYKTGYLPEIIRPGCNLAWTTSKIWHLDGTQYKLQGEAKVRLRRHSDPHVSISKLGSLIVIKFPDRSCRNLSTYFISQSADQAKISILPLTGAVGAADGSEMSIHTAALPKRIGSIAVLCDIPEPAPTGSECAFTTEPAEF